MQFGLQPTSTGEREKKAMPQENGGIKHAGALLKITAQITAKFSNGTNLARSEIFLTGSLSHIALLVQVCHTQIKMGFP